jgi:hypothetical protein
MFEWLIENQAFWGAVAILARNGYGWAVNSLKDGKIQKYELKQLGKTFVILGGFAVAIYYGAAAFTPEGVSPENAAAIAVLVDIVRSHFRGAKAATPAAPAPAQ